MLVQSEDCAIQINTAANQETQFAITDIKLYVPVVTLSTDDNAKLLQQLISGSKSTSNSQYPITKNIMT